MIKKNFYIILFFLILIIIITSIHKTNIESLGGLNRVNPFDLAGNSSWSFPDSNNKWYNPIQSKQYNFSELGFTLPNYKMSFVFLYKCTEVSNGWRGIFLFSDDPGGGDCWWRPDPKPNCRIPGLFVWPGSANLHFRIHTNSHWNDGANYSLPVNETVLVTIVINNNTVKFYKNNQLVSSDNFNGIKPRTNNTKFTVTNWNHQDSNTLSIKNLTFYDGELSQEDVNKIYKKLQDDYVL